MQITVHYTPQSIHEATDLNRRLWRRALGLATSARAFVYLIAGLWFGFALFARGLRSPEMRFDTYAGAAILFAVTTIALLTSRRKASRIQKALRAQPDQQLTLDLNGITHTSRAGAPAFEPWSAFTTFQEGRTIVFLHRVAKAPAQVIPTDTLTPTQTGELRSILLTHLPEKL